MATIARFTLVQVHAAQNSKAAVKVWDPDASEEPGLGVTNRQLGITMTSSNGNQQVAVMQFGYMRAVPERSGETWAVRDTLWGLDGGEVSNVQPAAPQPQIHVGTVYRSAGDGTHDVVVNVRVLPSLGELSGVARETPVDFDVFVFDAASACWTPRQLEVSDLRDGLTWHYAIGGF